MPNGGILMNRQKLAIILIGCALVLALGAYLLIPKQEENSTSLRQEVSPPEETAQAPAWVEKGQESEPDYTPLQKKEQEEEPTSEQTDTTAKIEKEDKQPAPQVIEVEEDSIVTFSFVESLAEYLLKNFQPQDVNGKPATKVSPKSLNMYFGLELKGFAVQVQNIRTARSSVLDYAFTPDMVRTLHQIYAPAFLAHLKETATNEQREYLVSGEKQLRILENIEVASMLRLNAVRLDQTASVFRTLVSDPSLMDDAASYLQAAKAVERYNSQLQMAIADNKDVSNASDRLKSAIIQRERIKNSIITKLGNTCGGCSPSDLFYLAQWSYRRTLPQQSDKTATFDAVAETLEDMAERFRQEAKKLAAS